MTREDLNVKKTEYQKKSEYFQKIGFDNLAADFQGVVDLISEIENYIKEKENGV
jgi:hypothetical protein